MARILLFCATVFLSAFLLFQIQPVIGKTILPWFGSSPGVWTTCLLFFQVLLLGGYTYAHVVVSRLAPKRQAIVHGALLLVALLVLPITPAAGLKPEGGASPILGILLVLGASVGLPYLVLSSTGPLLQGWFARLHPGRSPYRLYALSNLGSLLALLSYPFWVEGHLRLREQAVTWSVGFGLFALLAGGCAWALARGRTAGLPRRVDADLPPPGTATSETGGDAPPRASDVLLWFSLSACGSALLLATTNQLCLDVAVVPFLWVVPLALYLLSFILTFDHQRWYVRPAFLALLPLVLLRAFRLVGQGAEASIDRQIVGYSVALFVACMCLHGELSRSKPAPRHLTFFFLVVSLGGAAGGLLVAVGAPAVFDRFYELPLLLVACFALAAVGAFRNALRNPPALGHLTWRSGLQALAIIGVAALVLWTTVEALDPSAWTARHESQAARAKAWFGALTPWLALPLLLPFVVGEVRRLLARRPWGAWWGDARHSSAVAVGTIACIGLLGFVGACVWVLRGTDTKVIARGRNFYGALEIREVNEGNAWQAWSLHHGRIMHGFQYKRRPGWPTSYYGPRSGVGLAVEAHPARRTPGRPFRIGVVGLGTGTMAAYPNARIDPDAQDPDGYARPTPASPRDVVRFYEINPMVRDWAEQYFTYLSDAQARGADTGVFLGDARLTMEAQLARGEAQAFDVLAIDAFSSDAIPIHLLTQECFELYFRHLAPDGVLAVHVTNRFIDLLPIVHRLGDALGKQTLDIADAEDTPRGVDPSDWVLVTSNAELVSRLRERARPLPAGGPLWTDDFSSVYDVLRRKEYDSVLDLLLGED